ncbi:hypothetical protein P9112_011999 [Eukaryota sp. TZLM1-RC]
MQDFLNSLPGVPFPSQSSILVDAYNFLSLLIPNKPIVEYTSLTNQLKDRLFSLKSSFSNVYFFFYREKRSIHKSFHKSLSSLVSFFNSCESTANLPLPVFGESLLIHLLSNLNIPVYNLTETNQIFCLSQHLNSAVCSHHFSLLFFNKTQLIFPHKLFSSSAILTSSHLASSLSIPQSLVPLFGALVDDNHQVSSLVHHKLVNLYSKTSKEWTLVANNSLIPAIAWFIKENIGFIPSRNDVVDVIINSVIDLALSSSFSHSSSLSCYWKNLYSFYHNPPSSHFPPPSSSLLPYGYSLLGTLEEFTCYPTLEDPSSHSVYLASRPIRQFIYSLIASRSVRELVRGQGGQVTSADVPNVVSLKPLVSLQSLGFPDKIDLLTVCFGVQQSVSQINHDHLPFLLPLIYLYNLGIPCKEIQALLAMSLAHTKEKKTSEVSSKKVHLLSQYEAVLFEMSVLCQLLEIFSGFKPFNLICFNSFSFYCSIIGRRKHLLGSFLDSETLDLFEKLFKVIVNGTLPSTYRLHSNHQSNHQSNKSLQEAETTNPYELLTG